MRTRPQLTAAVLLLLPAPGLAEVTLAPRASNAPPAASTMEGAPGPARSPLGALPRPPSLELPPPAPGEVEALKQHLVELVSVDAATREAAIRAIVEVERGRLSALQRRLQSLGDGADHQAMKATLLAILQKEKKTRSGPADEEDRTLDYLAALSRHAQPDARAWRDVVHVVAMARMLRQIGTVGAARELVGIYARFGEFLRLEMQRELSSLGERATAALIEAERHPAKKISSWAARQLDAIGKAIPSEATQTSDPEVLADVLRAYGRTRNPEAARLVVSFVSSERAQIRDAARQAVVMMGEVGMWQLRDTYENVVGRKPAREWSWDRLARELFAEFDRLRLAEVYALLERGLHAERQGRLDEMSDLYDEVLAQSPNFERAPEMFSGYLALAEAHLEDAPDRAILALSRVRRIAHEDDPSARKAQSLLLTLEAERLLKKQLAEPLLLTRALEADPKNARAAGLKAALDPRGRSQTGRLERYLGALAIGIAALTSVAIILFRRRREPILAAATVDTAKPASTPNVMGSRPDAAEAPEGEPAASATSPSGAPPRAMDVLPAVDSEPTRKPPGGDGEEEKN